jgi:P27 family predicted phage terminase small subunit
MPEQPPWNLKPEARAIWDRHAARLKAEGRIGAVDLDALAVYSETLATHIALQAAVDEHGVMIPGARTTDPVKNPVLPALAATRDSLMRLARAVPLTDAAAAMESARFDKWMDSLDDGDEL